MKDSRRRHSRQASHSKALSPPSTVSVLSTSTSGSNSTVTPERPFQSSLRPSKRLEPKEPVMKEPTPPDVVHNGSSEHHSDKENFDVFAFMEKDEKEVESDTEEDEEDGTPEDAADEATSTTSTSSSIDISSPRASEVIKPATENVRTEEPRNWRKEKSRVGSLHSDSGISVRSSSPERESPVPRHKYPAIRRPNSSAGQMPPAVYPAYHALTNSPETYGVRTSAYPRDWSTSANPLENPEAYYGSARPVVTKTVQRARPPVTEPYARRGQQLVRGPPALQVPKTRSKSGYDMLASAISPRGDALLKPIYRKFETLNHRILLYLQDEISEMEADLRELDHAIAMEDEALGKKHASRRAEGKLPTRLQWHRFDLLGRSYTKVEQYSEWLFGYVGRKKDLTPLLDRALSSYSNFTKSLEPASHADINAYREWITEHAPIVEHEAAFLHNEADLIAVTMQNRVSSSSTYPSSRNELESPIIIVAATLVSTIIVFKVVPQILARLVISALVGIASLCTLSPSVLSNPSSIRDWGRGISMYVINPIHTSGLVTGC